MKAIKLIRGPAVAVALAGLSVGAVQAGDENQEAEFKAAIEKADNARKKAASVGGEWRDTGKMIKKAKAAAGKNDYSSALKLAHDAYRQGELGYQQAMAEKDVGFPDYLK